MSGIIFFLFTFNSFNINTLSVDYVKLVLDVGQHDPYFVDAYYGPDQWQQEAKGQVQSLPQLQERVQFLLKALDEGTGNDLDKLNQRRLVFLKKQALAMKTRIQILQGQKFSFDEESRLLYDAVSPSFSPEYYDDILKQVSALLPGDAPLEERVELFKKEFIIPPEKVKTVFATAIEKARGMTLEKAKLPSKESFKVEYVQGEPWAAYNWYQGGYQSLIQVNTDMDIFIDRAVDLACHEGYPGHHVYNTLLEKNLVNDHNFVEFSVYPLFSPQSLIAEGSANFGIEMLFPNADREAYEKTVLFPLAGLDPAKVDTYYRLLSIQGKLSYAGNDAARKYLDGEFDEQETLTWLKKYLLMSPKRAQQRLNFIKRYRSYVINYNLGLDLVRDYVHARAHDESEKWKVFMNLLSMPVVPSMLDKL